VRDPKPLAAVPVLPCPFRSAIWFTLITSDGSKTHARNWYVVVSVDGLWCNVRKFTGSQLPSTFYRVKLSECYRVPDLTETMPNLSRRYSTDSYPEDIDKEPLTSGYVDEEPAHLPTPQSTRNPAPALVPSELTTTPCQILRLTILLYPSLLLPRTEACLTTSMPLSRILPSQLVHTGLAVQLAARLTSRTTLLSCRYELRK